MPYVFPKLEYLVCKTFNLKTLAMKMKFRLLFFLFISLSFSYSGFGQKLNPKYDSTLAEKLGADKYGMKNYFFVLLKTGENKSDNKAAKDSAFAGHMDNINKMVKEGKLIVAGPFGKNNHTFRGLFILQVASREEAEIALKSDPAIAKKYLEALIVPWYGSAALSEYLPASEKVNKFDF
jgi:uncharacterized protein YciI